MGLNKKILPVINAKLLNHAVDNSSCSSWSILCLFVETTRTWIMEYEEAKSFSTGAQ
jgi:hypothetical protein